MKSRNEREIAKLGYTCGLNVVYNLRKNIGFEAGLHFSNKGYQTRYQDLIYADMIDAQRGFVYNLSNPMQVRYIYKDYYIDIPLKINLLFGKRKIINNKCRFCDQYIYRGKNKNYKNAG
jgi:hypothetical protein